MNPLWSNFLSYTQPPFCTEQVANCLAPSSMLPKSDSPPPTITASTAAGNGEDSTTTSNSESVQVDEGGTIPTTAASAATVNSGSSGSPVSSAQTKPSSSGNQQAIVAVMEDGRQVFRRVWLIILQLLLIFTSAPIFRKALFFFNAPSLSLKMKHVVNDIGNTGFL